MTMPQPNTRKTSEELREQFKRSGLVLEWVRFTGANKTMIDEYVDVLVHYANVAIAEARKEEVNRIAKARVEEAKYIYANAIYKDEYQWKAWFNGRLEQLTKEKQPWIK